MFLQGVLPAVDYGTQVWGYSHEEVRNLQTFYLAATSPPGKGKSRSLSLLLFDDVAWRPAVAPIVAFAILVWQAITDPVAAVANLATLYQWFSAAKKKPPPRHWGDVCGPFSAMDLSLRRIQWQHISFAVFRDQNGIEHNISKIGPKMITSLLRGAWRHRLGKIAAAQVAS